MASESLIGNPLEFFQSLDWKAQHPKQWAKALAMVGGDEGAAQTLIADANFGLSRPANPPSRQDLERRRENGLMAMRAYSWDARKFRRDGFKAGRSKRRSNQYWRMLRSWLRGA